MTNEDLLVDLAQKRARSLWLFGATVGTEVTENTFVKA